MIEKNIDDIFTKLSTTICSFITDTLLTIEGACTLYHQDIIPRSHCNISNIIDLNYEKIKLNPFKPLREELWFLFCWWYKFVFLILMGFFPVSSLQGINLFNIWNVGKHFPQRSDKTRRHSDDTIGQKSSSVCFCCLTFLFLLAVIQDYTHHPNLRDGSLQARCS